MAGAAHGLHVERENTIFDPSYLVVLHKQDPSLAVGVCNEVTFVLKILEASRALLDGVKVVVQHNSFKNEGFLTRFRGLFETLGITRIAKLRMNVNAICFIVGPHTVRRSSVCCARNAELYRMIVIAVEGLL